jgi:hypothetical protein
MTYKLFLDDERDPPDGVWTVARTFEEATAIVLDRGLPEYISFDHDLGVNSDGTLARTGADFARWIGDFALETDNNLGGFQWYVHSQNPIGRENIEAYLRSLIRHLRG